MYWERPQPPARRLEPGGRWVTPLQGRLVEAPSPATVKPAVGPDIACRSRKFHRRPPVSRATEGKIEQGPGVRRSCLDTLPHRPEAAGFPPTG